MPWPSSSEASVTDPSPETGPGHPRRYVIFGIVSLALLMASVDQTIVSTALASLQRELKTGVQWGGWVITIYALGQVLIMPVAGRLSDAYGRRTIFLVAAVVFTAASLLCGISANIDMLIAMRFVQAIGGGAFLPAATGLVADHFGRGRDRAIGMFSSIFPIGGVLGPILGGLILSLGSWRIIFLVNVPIGIALVILGALFFPPGARGTPSRLDVVGVVLLGTLLAAAMLGVAVLGTSGSGGAILMFAVFETIAAAALALFLRHIRRASDAFISIDLFVGDGFGTMNALNFLFGACMLGLSALLPVYAQEKYGIPVFGAGALLTVRAVGMIIIAGVATLLLRRTGYRTPMIVGSALIAAGLGLIALAPADSSAFFWLSVGACVTGLGMGLTLPASNNASLHLRTDHVAATTGLRSMFRQAGGIASVSVATSFAARSEYPGTAYAEVFLVFAAVLLCSIPFVTRVPEHRGSW